MFLTDANLLAVEQDLNNKTLLPAEDEGIYRFYNMPRIHNDKQGVELAQLRVDVNATADHAVVDLEVWEKNCTIGGADVLLCRNPEPSFGPLLCF